MNVTFAAIMGGWEMILILMVVLVLFGAKKIPELAKGLGQGIKEFKKATRDVQDELQAAMDEPPPPPRRYPPVSNPEPPPAIANSSSAAPESTPQHSSPEPKAKVV